jgi:PAS domain S-box-containing protein
MKISAISDLNDIQKSRTLLVLTSSLLVAFGIYSSLYDNQKYDPLWLRTALASYGFGCVTLSFRYQWFKEKLDTFLQIGVGLVFLWIQIMLYHNQFNERFTSLSFIALAAMGFGFKRKEALLAYIVACSIGTFITFLLVSIHHIELPITFLMHYVLVGLVSYFILSNLLVVQASLNRGNKIFQNLLDSTEDIYILVDKDYKVVSFNNRARNYIKVLTGRVLKEGESFISILRFENQQMVRNWINEALRGKSEKMEIPLVSNGDNKYWFSVQYFPLKKRNEITHVTFIARNITESKRKEEEILSAKEVAEKASSAKANFLSTMSHEIRTPMNAVIGMTHLLMEQNPSPEQKENLKTLKFSAQNLLGLINDILDFNKIDAGKVSLEIKPFDLKELLEELKHTFDHRATTKNIGFSLKLEDNIPGRICGDQIRLNQVLSNLLNNALKFTEKGGVIFEVKLVQATEKRARILFSISDTGIGIPEDKLTSIFEDFTQAQTDTTRKYGGSGLGLAISRSLLEIFGSDLKVESVIDQGSRFYFELELDIDQELKEETKKDANKNLNKARILLAEDHEINQMLAMKFLDNWNGLYDLAVNGKEAVDLVIENDYDAILMDLQMPVMDGFEASQKIRRLNGKKGKIPIIALTASALKEIEEQVYSSGMDDFVVKPFNPEELYRKLEKLSQFQIKQHGKA